MLAKYATSCSCGNNLDLIISFKNNTIKSKCVFCGKISKLECLKTDKKWNKFIETPELDKFLRGLLL